jgi:hypothetical protein
MGDETIGTVFLKFAGTKTGERKKISCVLRIISQYPAPFRPGRKTKKAPSLSGTGPLKRKAKT